GGGGLGGGLGSILMMALFGVAVVFLVRMLMSRQRTEPLPAGAQSMSYQSMGHETVAAPPPSQAAGFDAPMPTSGPNVPAGFDVTGFVRQAKLSYIRMQVANDAGKLDELREMSTPDMYATLKADVEQRAGQAQTTDFGTNAGLLPSCHSAICTEALRQVLGLRLSHRDRHRWSGTDALGRFLLVLGPCQ
ncbi:MAG: hypothetical protein EBZ60_05410, partial [Betaproteobacteria bacterium]|nr:hypothetical protein [Betaproteobacteria bacterium]